MRNAQSGFSVLELLAAITVVGVLSAVVVPSLLSSKAKADAGDPHVELAKIEAAARTYYLAEGKFPGSTVMALPGPNGAACSNTSKRFPVSSLWSSDPVWATLGFHVDQANGWTYHFETTSPTTASIRAVGDPDCDGKLTTVQIDVDAVALGLNSDEENDGSDDSGKVVHSWDPQAVQYPIAVNSGTGSTGSTGVTRTNLANGTTTQGNGTNN